MLSLNRLKDIKYIEQKQSALLLARRTASEPQQKIINFELNIIYNAKYNLLEEMQKNENK